MNDGPILIEKNGYAANPSPTKEELSHRNFLSGGATPLPSSRVARTP